MYHYTGAYPQRDTKQSTDHPQHTVISTIHQSERGLSTKKNICIIFLKKCLILFIGLIGVNESGSTCLSTQRELALLYLWSVRRPSLEGFGKHDLGRYYQARVEGKV